MTHVKTATLRLSLIVVAAVLLTIGLIARLSPLAIAGAAVYFAEGLLSMFVLYCVSKRYRAGTIKFEEDRAPSERIGRWIGRAVTIAGLVLVVITRDGDFPDFVVAGWLIWGGAIFFYLISGWIVSEVAGIPMHMGYGGWTFGHGPRRR